VNQENGARDTGEPGQKTGPPKPDTPHTQKTGFRHEQPVSDSTEDNEKPNGGVTKASGGEQPSNPFAEVSSEEFNSHRAYLRGRQTFAHGSATFIDSSQLGDVHIGNRIQHFYVANHGRLAHGPIRSEVLELIRACYVPVARYQSLLETLSCRNVVVLRGRPGAGRTTTGIHMLDRLSAGRVARLGAEEALRIDEVSLENGMGYLVHQPTADTGDLLQETYLDRVAALLRSQGCYFAIIAEPDPLRPDTLGGYIEECPSPDIEDVIVSHLNWAIRDLADDGLRENLQEIALRLQTREALGPVPRMTEVVNFAGLLVRYGREGLSYDRVLSLCHEFLLRQVLEWFSDLRTASRGSELNREVRLASFRVALAVFNGMSYHDVAEAADELAQKMIRVATSRRYLPVQGGDWRNHLPALRAELYNDAFEEIHDVVLPVRAVRFQDQRFPEIVIAYLWRWHDMLRAPFIDWLTELSTRSRTHIWIRAALALGVVCSLDFPSVFDTQVQVWANSDDATQRMAAAVALDQAARDDSVRPAVKAILRAWVRSGTFAERWTAAATLGHDIGLDDVETSIDELRIVGTSKSNSIALTPSLASISSWSASALLSAGKVEPVLRNIRSWLCDRRCRHMALMTSLRIMFARVSDADVEAHGIKPGRERWPLAVALYAKDNQLGGELADIIWHALRLPPAQEIALSALAQWIRRSEAAGYQRELAGFLPLLIDCEADRQRLMHLLATMRHSWVDPLNEGVAEFVERAICKARHDTTCTA